MAATYEFWRDLERRFEARLEALPNPKKTNDLHANHREVLPADYIAHKSDVLIVRIHNADSRENVSLQRRTWVIEASKEKTRTERSGMLSSRLSHLLEMRQLDPAGEPWSGEAYIFGDELGRRLSLATIRERWTALVARVGLERLQMRDMRHEGANQYEETGTPISEVSQLLGHTNLATTSRYLRNKRRRMAQLAVSRLDQARADAAQARALAAEGEPTDRPGPDEPTSSRSH